MGINERKTKFRVCVAPVARNVEAPVEKDRASSDKWPPPSRRLSSDRTGTDAKPLERHESATRCLQIKACSRFRQRLLAAPTLPRDVRRRVDKGHRDSRSGGLAVIQLRIDQPKGRGSQLLRTRLEDAIVRSRDFFFLDSKDSVRTSKKDDLFGRKKFGKNIFEKSRNDY